MTYITKLRPHALGVIHQKREIRPIYWAYLTIILKVHPLTLGLFQQNHKIRPIYWV